MAEKSAAVRKALAIMAKNKKKRDAEGQMSSDAAGTPAYMQGKKTDSGIGAEASNAPGQSPRALIEQQNNALAQELLKKQQKKIKGY